MINVPNSLVFAGFSDIYKWQYYTHIKEEMLKKATVDLEGVFKKRAGKE